ncbi:MAG: hypothetical protein R3B82_04875 [Sandaracinaceae bacterium]
MDPAGTTMTTSRASKAPASAVAEDVDGRQEDLREAADSWKIVEEADAEAEPSGQGHVEELLVVAAAHRGSRR